jgi:uncharacterized membrane protein YhaH (DUF805 family)
MDLQKLFLTADGRIARQDFWIGIVILIVANIVLGMVTGFLGWMIGGVWGAIILAGLVGLAMIVPSYFLMVKRSNDRDYPQTYVQALVAVNIAFQLQSMIMPVGASGPGMLSMIVYLLLGIAGLWALVDLGFFQGTRGPNRYGPDPLEPARA